MSFYSSGIQTKITRTYKSVVQTLSLIGGINSFVFLIFFYLTALYTRFVKDDIMVGMVYPYLRSPEAYEELSISNNANMKQKHVAGVENYKKIKEVATSQLERSLDLVHMSAELDRK